MAGGRRLTTPEVGWALGDGREHGEDPAWDAVEAEALYALLEKEVAPAFYSRDQQGIPVAWVARMRESMARLTPAVFRQPHGAGVYRDLLPAGRRRFPSESGRQGGLRGRAWSSGSGGWRSIGITCVSVK